MTYLGIDIGGTRVKAGLVDANGAILRAAHAVSPTSREALAALLTRLAGEVCAGQRPAAAGFGCKGVVDPASTAVKNMPGMWSFLAGFELSGFVRPLLEDGAPVGADNDAKAALAGEMVWGAARGRGNVVLLTLGTGVGGAVLADGRILRGAGDVAGHLGHVSGLPDGPLCFCGNRGCLEALFSARAIEGAVWEAMHRGCTSPMLDELRASAQAPACDAVYRYAAAGDAVARQIVEERTRILGAALAGILHAFDPEIVILSGSIAEAGPALFEPLQRDIDQRVAGLLKRSVPLVASGVQDTSGVAGAAALGYLRCQLAQ